MMDIGDAAELQRDLGRLEGTVAAQGERISTLDERLERHNKDTMEKLDRLITFQERQKGAGRLLLAISTVCGSIFGLVASWVFDFFKHPAQ